MAEHGEKEALYYTKRDGGRAECALCPRHCAPRPGEAGACRARRNDGGTLYSLNYAKISSLNLDPIEKKPLRRFMPGGMILSAGSFGCNFFCPFCQNYAISQFTPPTRTVSPEALVRAALSAKQSGNVGLAFTYNEPAVWYEYVREAAELAHARGLLNVLVTNGYIELEPLRALLPAISAMNIDIKGGEAFYREMCGGSREAVLRTLREAYAAGCHVEATLLLVSGRNDNMRAVTETAASIASVSDEIPLHLSRFFPRYRMEDAQPTDAGFIYSAAKAAGAILKYVYTGNI